MGVLDRKLLRDLWRMKGQVLAVGLVIASGVALLVMALSTLTSLQSAAQTYYERYRFADVFAGATRVPDRLADRIAAIPGVQTVEPRVMAYSTVDMDNVAEPVMAQLISVPGGRQPLLNRLAIRQGRIVSAGRDDEAVVHEPFAEAHGLVIGDTLSVLMNGVKREVRIVGIALSPEHVYAIAPGGLMPDDSAFAIIWMARAALAAAYDLDGAFNSVTLALLRNADPDAVIQRLDPLLARYGGTGAVARADQLSNWFLMNEFAQMRSMVTILPTIFLVVACFLTYTVLGRLIATERREISLMKAFGYSNLQVGWHYMKLALVMAVVGIVLGFALGAVLGWFNTAQYTNLFRFPFRTYRPSGVELVISGGIALAVAALGAIGAVRTAVKLPPAEAMRPPTPETFRTAALPDGVARRLDNPTRIILRQIARAPLRSSMTVVGIAFAVGLLISALQWPSTIDTLVANHFQGGLRHDVTIAFHEVRDSRARHALARLPGVRMIEPFRGVAADLRSGARKHRGSLTGLPANAGLQVIRDVDGTTLPVPGAGLVLGSMLAAKLGVRPGDMVEIEVLERDHPQFSLPVTGIVETYIEMPAYVSLEVLNGALGDPAVFTLAHLLVDEALEDRLFAELKEMPGLAGVMIKRQAIASMYETIGESILIFTGFFIVFSCTLTYGVVYNSTRIALSERARELATLRILGFTRWDISYILLGEAALLVLAALPVGSAVGYGLVALIVEAFETELFRLPFVVPPSIYAYAIAITLAAGIASAAYVRRHLDHLDLIEVLKTRE